MAEAPLPVRAEARVVANRAQGGANWRLTLRVEGFPGFAPGQFAMLSPGARSAAERSDPLLPRPMAVYAAAAAGDGAADVSILYKVSGRGTTLLAEARPDQVVRFVGPLGRCFADPDPEERAILVAGGTGIASLYPLAARLAGRGRETRVLLGARSADDLMGREDFEALGLTLRVATEDGSLGQRGLVTALLEDELAPAGPSRVYTCGPNAMMRASAEWAARHGRPCVASLENTMACGFGVCLGCAAPLRAPGYALVCRDGPVFDAAAVDWDGLP